jgi:hypothetical protein
VTAALLALAVVAPRLQAQQVPEKYQKTVAKGLDWLAAQQAADGSWSGRDGAYKVTVTALAGTALALEGSTTREGKYAKNLQLAVAFLLKHSQKGGDADGLIADLSDQSKELRYLFGHGYALEFLARAVGEEENAKRRGEIKDVLIRGVKYLARTQTKEGGWYFWWAKDQNANDGMATGVQLAGLRAARNAGIAVPKETYNKAKEYLRNTTAASGGVVESPTQRTENAAVTAAALAVALGSGDRKDDHTKRWLRYCRKEIPLSLGLGEKAPPRIGYLELAHYSFARAMMALGDSGWDRLFGKDTPDRLTWTAYRVKVFEELARAQQPDGSWPRRDGFSIGGAYESALYLTILQMDHDAPVPLYPH